MSAERASGATIGCVGRLAPLLLSAALALGVTASGTREARAAGIPRIFAEVHVTALLDATGVRFLSFRVTRVPAATDLVAAQ